MAWLFVGLYLIVFGLEHIGAGFPQSNLVKGVLLIIAGILFVLESIKIL